MIGVRLKLVPAGKTLPPYTTHLVVRLESTVPVQLQQWLQLQLPLTPLPLCHLSPAITLINSASASNGNVPVVAVELLGVAVGV